MTLRPEQPDDLFEARELILALCHERLPKDGQARLEALMLERPDVRLLYLEMLRVHAILRLRAGSFSMLQLDADTVSEADMSDAMILPALTPAEPEPEASPLPVFVAPKPLPAPEPLRRLRLPGWRPLASMAAAAAIVLTVSVFFMHQAARQSVAATILKSSDARFDGTDLDAAPGAAIPTGKGFTLASGFVELKFHGGADVVVQAPATFSIDSGVAMGLTSGRISATADGAAHGFVVQTPIARATDLGTAFGVTVEPAGQTEVDVFQGRVEVAQVHAPGDLSTAQSPTVLSVGQAAVVANGTVKPLANGAAPQSFVRSLAAPASIDLVDLICGGDGTSGLRSGGIDPRTGASGLLQPDFDIQVANSDYHTVPELPVVDGCFVPNGKMMIDSVGHRFDFGKTTAKSFYQIRAGGHIPWSKPGLGFTANLGGVDYAQPGHGFFLLHPNAGITFDLAALRKLHPGLKIFDLRSIVGNPCPRQEYDSVSRVRVFVNGTARFDRQISRKDGPLDMNVPLNDSDQFLTMVATDDGVSPRYDWIIIADPRFE